MIKVSDRDIQYAEEILLNQGQKFDSERREFISNFNTIDLQAVPGSGKTTALLAKLLILEKRLPLKNSRGILVLSHTNAAINEIKERIGTYCPKLFSHPNYVGTIQSFVDKFLAIPAYAVKYKKKPVRIDDEIYNETISKLFYFGKKGFSDQDRKNAIYYNRVFNVLRNFRFKNSGNDLKLVEKINGKDLEIKTPKPRKKKFSQEEILKIYEWLKITKENTFKAGTLCFDDAYFLAEVILEEIPEHKRILQKRFEYVFVDEMQDMELHQIRLIEKLYLGYNCGSKLQRLGDVNQSIYSKEVNIEQLWKPGINRLYFKGSHRLSKPIARIVESASITKTPIEGRGVDEEGDDIVLKPLLIVFEEEKANHVIPKFSEKIKEYQDNGLLPKKNQIYHAFGWRKKTDAAHKLSIKSYIPGQEAIASSKKIEYETLEDYLLVVPKEGKSLRPYRNAILNGLVKVFRRENAKDEYGRYFTPSRLLFLIKRMDDEKYELFKKKIFEWCDDLLKTNFNHVISDLRNFIPVLLNWFNLKIQYSKDFINGTSENDLNDLKEEIRDFYDKDGFKINISTVHNIKGQTHQASLYLETFWEGKYESERLGNQLMSIPLDITKKELTEAAANKLIQTAKMVYVGFSRPTHLLGFAVEKSRFDSNLKEIDKDLWEIQII